MIYKQKKSTNWSISASKYDQQSSQWQLTEIRNGWKQKRRRRNGNLSLQLRGRLLSPAVCLSVVNIKWRARWFVLVFVLLWYFLSGRHIPHEEANLLPAGLLPMKSWEKKTKHSDTRAIVPESIQTSRSLTSGTTVLTIWHIHEILSQRCREILWFNI